MKQNYGRVKQLHYVKGNLRIITADKIMFTKHFSLAYKCFKIYIYFIIPSFGINQMKE